MGIADRIKEQRKKRGISQVKLAKDMGLSLRTVNRWEAGERSPRAEDLTRLAIALDTTIGYLSGETDDPTLSPMQRPINTALKEILKSRGDLPYFLKPTESNVRAIKTVKVPLIGGVVKACCGVGNAYASDVEYDVEGEIEIPVSELEGYAWQVGPGGFHTMRIEGDSMEPRIHDGETILYGDLPYNNGNFVLVRYDDRLIVRGIWNDHNGHYRLRAVNPDYEDIEVDTSDESKDFYILGKVIRVISIRSVADGMM